MEGGEEGGASRGTLRRGSRLEMERAGTTGVDAAVPMVESSARLACDGGEEDDDKSWYDTYNMTGDGEKKK